MAPSIRKPYNGLRRKLILTFDIGTTFSGISYSILNPGEIPEIKGVTRFPSQEQVGGDSKIPTIIYYDRDGKVRAVGAEAIKEGLENVIEDEGWMKAEWFKLHLRPGSAGTSSVSENIPPLPPNKSVTDLFADFMKYLFDCARSYIHDTYANGRDIWSSVERSNNIEFVLTHPNGWEGAQQARMRRAAIQAGLVPDSKAGRERVHFVTEGEASLHFCIQSGLTMSAINKGEGVLIVDAGGGTVDLSAYSRKSPKDSFQEIAAPQCFFQGSIFVTRHARAFLEVLLRDSRWQDDVDYIAKRFDNTTKLTFRNCFEPQYIRFGTARDKDTTLGIRSGQLRLAGSDVAGFFEPSISCIADAIRQQRMTSNTIISSVFLVGGFAASDWLFEQLKTRLNTFGLIFCRPDSHVNKAVADGGVSYFIDHFVTMRVSKYTYGMRCGVLYDNTRRDHIARLSKVYINCAGETRVHDAFDVIVSRDTQVSETKEFRRSYNRVDRSRAQLISSMCETIRCYRGRSKDPRWLDEDQDNYSVLCNIVVDGKRIEKIVSTRRAPDLSTYYRIDYDIVLNFGLTELTAQVCWKQNGQEHRSQAEIVYDPDVVDSEE